MFHRVLLEDWHRTLPVIGFALTSAVFFGAIIRALITKKENCNHLSHLPLDDEDTSGLPGSAAIDVQPSTKS